MPAIENRTPFTAIDLLAFTRAAEECIVLCVAGTFDLPAPRGAMGGPPARAEEQPPPPLVDVYWGEPGASSLRREGQAAYHRPGTDVLVSGHAWAARGRPARQVVVDVRVGPVRRRALVSGDRVWRTGAFGLAASEAKPFESMPLVYERSFGGVAAAPPEGFALVVEARNPVGAGLYTSARDAEGKPLPNVEDPAAPIERWSDRPAPIGFGPIARSWQPRKTWAGTYDEAWSERRAPLWPDDLDMRFFHAAPEGAIATPWLRGGEPVVLDGLSPDGVVSFSLPSHALAADAVFRDRTDTKDLVIDAVEIDVEARRLTMIWRAAFVAHRRLADHERCVIREIGAGAT